MSELVSKHKSIYQPQRRHSDKDGWLNNLLDFSKIVGYPNEVPNRAYRRLPTFSGDNEEFVAMHPD